MKMDGIPKTKKGKTGRIAGKLQAPATNPITVVSLRTRPIPLQLARTGGRIPSRNRSLNHKEESSTGQLNLSGASQARNRLGLMVCQ